MHPMPKDSETPAERNYSDGSFKINRRLPRTYDRRSPWPRGDGENWLLLLKTFILKQDTGEGV